MQFLPDHIAPDTIAAGCDEAGRGCLAGPVFAAAVILSSDHPIDGLNDSKKLSETQRNELRLVIEQEAVAWAVAKVDPPQIDDENILWASISAMHLAIRDLGTTPELLLIDGNRFKPYESVPYECIIKGDSKVSSIAAASILAKTYRDEYMLALHQAHPHYAWDSNKGYPTVKHREAIMAHGPTEHHRKSFRLYPDGQQQLFN